MKIEIDSEKKQVIIKDIQISANNYLNGITRVIFIKTKVDLILDSKEYLELQQLLLSQWYD